MLSQLCHSLEHDYYPQYKPWQSPPEPIDKWIERNISMAQSDIEYYKEKISVEEKRIAETNAYLNGLYYMLDKVKPYKETRL